jgi:hypothetical protein
MFDGFGAKVFPTLRERKKKFFRFESKREKKKKKIFDSEVAQGNKEQVLSFCKAYKSNRNCET